MLRPIMNVVHYLVNIFTLHKKVDLEVRGEIYMNKKVFNELNEKRKRFRSDIEASERGIKIEEEVAKRTGNDEALKFKKKMLEKRIKEFEENETY